MRKYTALWLGGGVILLLFALFFSVSYTTLKPADAVYISPSHIFLLFFKLIKDIPLDVTDKIALFRMQRVLAAAISGVLLAVGGNLYQTILNNPLVDPYILGVSAGASLGAVIAYRFNLPGPVWIYAFSLSLISFFISYLIGKGNKLKIVLSGVVMSSLISAGITLVLIMWRDSLHNILAWLMGSFALADGYKITLQFGVMVIVVVIVLLTIKVLDIMMLGDEIAYSVGINTNFYKVLYLTVASLAASFVASFYGIVSFVGLMSPHIARIIVGDKHLAKVLLSMEVGAIILVVGDFLSRGVLYPTEIPIGVFTSVLGGLFFLYLVVRGDWQ